MNDNTPVENVAIWFWEHVKVQQWEEIGGIGKGCTHDDKPRNRATCDNLWIQLSQWITNILLHCLRLTLLDQRKLIIFLTWNIFKILALKRAFYRLHIRGESVLRCSGNIPDTLPRWQGAPCRRRVSAKLGAMETGRWQNLWQVCWDAGAGSKLRTYTVNNAIYTSIHPLDTYH